MVLSWKDPRDFPVTRQENHYNKVYLISMSYLTAEKNYLVCYFCHFCCNITRWPNQRVMRKNYIQGYQTLYIYMNDASNFPWAFPYNATTQKISAAENHLQKICESTFWFMIQLLPKMIGFQSWKVCLENCHNRNHNTFIFDVVRYLI